MINITNAFKQEKNKETNQPIHLYTVYDYDDAGADHDLHFAEYAENVTFDGVEYLAFPLAHDTIGENTQGEIEAIKLTVCNISRLIQSYLELYDLKDKKVLVRLVWKDHLDDPDNKMDFVYFIDSYTANENNVEFTLLPKVDVLGLTIPRRVYSRYYCGWRFKGSECAYAGSESSCNRTKQRCKELANFARFGGFPSIPSRQLYVS